MPRPTREAILHYLVGQVLRRLPTACPTTVRAILVRMLDETP